MTVTWTERPLGRDTFRRSVTINLEGIEPGPQEILLHLTLEDGAELSRRVAFTVAEASTVGERR